MKFESASLSGDSPHNKHENTAIAAVSCGPEDDRAQPLNTTIQAKVPFLIDSSHLKTGSKLILKLTTNWQNGKCYLPQDSVLYGHVTEARSTKSPDSSEMSLIFDSVECLGGSKSDVALKIVGLIAAPDQFVGMQNAIPVQVAGGGRSISAAAQNMGTGMNQFSMNLNPDGPPDTIKPGIVKGLPKVKLEPQGGPGCSAKISSEERSIHLGSGAQFILTPGPVPAGGQ